MHEVGTKMYIFLISNIKVLICQDFCPKSPDRSGLLSFVDPKWLINFDIIFIFVRDIFSVNFRSLKWLASISAVRAPVWAVTTGILKVPVEEQQALQQQQTGVYGTY